MQVNKNKYVVLFSKKVLSEAVTTMVHAPVNKKEEWIRDAIYKGSMLFMVNLATGTVFDMNIKTSRSLQSFGEFINDSLILELCLLPNKETRLAYIDSLPSN